MATGKTGGDDILERVERERRAAIHRQLGALESKLKHWQWFSDPPAKAVAAKLKNKIRGLKRKLVQSEIRFGSAPNGS